jgi:hypothetical protein
MVTRPRLFRNSRILSINTASLRTWITFYDVMKDLGQSSCDGGGTVTFTGSDPILRSHFRTDENGASNHVRLLTREPTPVPLVRLW